jgi:hypothetical protein
MFGIYLQDVLPFRFMIDTTTPRHGFIFGDVNGPWSTDQLTKTLARETGTRLGFRMTFQDYRHISTGIDREFIRGKDANLDEDDDNDDDIHDLMAAHSSKLANARYARLGGLTRSLTSESIDLFRTISDKWQAWYKLETRRLGQPQIKMETESSKDENYTTRCINNALCKMYGQGAKFRNDQQRTAVMSAASGVDQLFVILPTGHGKSLTFMLPNLYARRFSRGKNGF